MILEMAAEGHGGRRAYGSLAGGLSYVELLQRARGAAEVVASSEADRVAVLAQNGLAVPVSLFGAGLAGMPYVPLNYRLADDTLRSLVEEICPALVVADPEMAPRVEGAGAKVIRTDDFLRQVAEAEPSTLPMVDPDGVAVELFTSGTTGRPKAALLRHRHLTSYLFGSVDFGGAGEDEATLISVPPYHIAGVAALLSSVYCGRRVVHLPSFDARAWVDVARSEGITHAMVVPTMLRRIVEVLAVDGGGIPSLRALSYGGGHMPVPVVERAMALLPEVDLVNAYGLTETSSTIAVLGPDDHRAAFGTDDPRARRRLGSVGRALPSVEIEVRDPGGSPAPSGVSGQVWVRGEQVSGEYSSRGRGLDADGWFPTNDGGFLDDDGYLFVEGRLDDVIVRGGENLSPGEIEDVLLAHPGIRDAAVVGASDEEWGEVVVSFVVPEIGAAVAAEEVRSWVQQHLRSSRAPAHVRFVEELPYNDTGKLLRRELRSQLAGATSESGA
jgi:acyl-CoA synthetase (AMP-forming)/AMP-acid ligase II